MAIGIFLGGTVLGLINVLLAEWLMRLHGTAEIPGRIIWSRGAIGAVLLGAAFLFAYHQLGWTSELLRVCIFLFFLLLVAIIDYLYGYILDSVMVAMGLLGIAAIPNAAYFAAGWDDAFWGFSIGGGSLFLLAWSSGKMGFGDAFFAGAIGLWLGWLAVVLVLLLSFFLGGVIGSILVIGGYKNRRDSIPFAPCLAVAAVVIYFYQNEVLRLLAVGWL